MAPGANRRLRGSIQFVFDGWDHDSREIYQIPLIRAYWAKLDAVFPAWTYYVVPGAALRVLALCLVPGLRVVKLGKSGFASVDYARDDMAQVIGRTAKAVTTLGVEDDFFHAYLDAYMRSIDPEWGTE